ncbi:MAG: hypothetical protein E7425_04585, partial [Ruminococcaceae bacterium]|nr:hypothetical protein [Oscillospiraceae bacterium]
MAEMITAREAAELWNLTPRRVSAMCKDGHIAGAVLDGNRWMIPSGTEKPIDHRVKTRAYSKENTIAGARLPLPIGVSDYRKAVSSYYYVDKTLMIRDLIDEKPEVALFTRPRRFGKTLNMDMLCTFFEKTEEDTSVYFRNKKIWRAGERYRSYQGKYPVIFLTFKDAKHLTWTDTLENIRFLLTNEFARHKELSESPKCSQSEKGYYKKIVEGKASEAEMMNALLMLSQMLDAHYGIAPIIIIDEYDVPIQQGHMQGFYDEVVAFMRNLFSGGFKDNKHLSCGFLTGILRVAKESIFSSGLNNLSVYSVMDESFSEYFGFTHDEVKQIASYYGVSAKYEELCEWYDGYCFGESSIFNPWSIINYFQRKCKLQPYWVSTSSNDVLGEILSDATPELYDKLNSLLQGNAIATYIDTGVVYPQIRNNPASVYSFLLMTGYLKVVHTKPALNDGFLCEVALPNREIAYVYKKEILDKLTSLIPQSTAIAVQEALYTGNVEALQRSLETLLLQSASYYDTTGEAFYQGLMLGLTAIMDNRYHVRSNRESGEGRYDLQLEPRDHSLPGILIEIKAEGTNSRADLKDVARDALDQIERKKYDAELKARGVRQILKYGVAFKGKHAEIIRQ